MDGISPVLVMLMVLNRSLEFLDPCGRPLYCELQSSSVDVGHGLIKNLSLGFVPRQNIDETLNTTEMTIHLLSNAFHSTRRHSKKSPISYIYISLLPIF